MSHKFKKENNGISWQCAFCGAGFPSLFARDQHEVSCDRRDGAKTTPQGRRVGTAY